jgi:hypothetical protein
MDYLQLILAGALLCNCIPHLAAGLQGRSFPTPFAKPRGVGRSSASVNVLWGAANLFVGLFLLVRGVTLAETAAGLAAMGLGFLALGIWLSRHFGRVEAAALHGE